MCAAEADSQAGCAVAEEPTLAVHSLTNFQESEADDAG